ncbi:MAG: type II secretion system F family protein [Thermoplasmatota archaeon]
MAGSTVVGGFERSERDVNIWDPNAVDDTYARVPAPVSPSRFIWVVYLALAAVVVISLALLVLTRTGFVGAPSSNARAPWDLAAIVLSLALTIGMAVIISRNALVQDEDVVLEAERRFARWETYTVLASVPVAGLFALAGVLAYVHALTTIGPWALGVTAPLVLPATGLLVAVSPFALIVHRHERRVRRIEDRFPDFLRDLNESYSAGMTVAQSIEASARGDYGELNPDIRRMANQVSWGTPFQEALSMFGERVGTPLVRRAVGLIIKATSVGGNVKDVLAAAARDAHEIRALERERRLNMSLYVIVIYISFMVFLAVTAALQGLFVPAILNVSQTGRGVNFGTLGVSHRLAFSDFRFIYFDVGLVQGIGSGIVAGYMAEGSLSAGLKHAALMVAISVVILGLIL